jgi:hypothetical protein
MKYCIACGMPLEKKEDFALGDENSDFCTYCVNADGGVKSCEEIFEGGVNFFMSKLGGDKVTAEKMVRKNMSQQPYWLGKECECLKGEMATDDEFADTMSMMM